MTRAALLAVWLWLMVVAVPSVDWLDSGHLVAAAWDLGVAHPPGETPWIVAAHLFQQLPLGDLASRTTLLSALSMIGLGVALRGLARHWAPGTDGWSAITFGLLSAGAVLQGGRPEVYAPVAALLVGSWCCVQVARGPRGVALGGLLAGQAAILHPLLAAAVAPALLLALLAAGGQRRMRSALVFGAASVVAIGWLPFLPLRALDDPTRAWGVPTTLGSMRDVFFARGFAQNFGGGAVDWAGNTRIVLSLAAEAWLPIFGLAAILGRRRGPGSVGYQASPEGAARPHEGEPVAAEGSDTGHAPWWSQPAIILGLWTAGVGATILSQNKVFITNPDVSGYLLVAFAPWSALAAGPLESTARAWPRPMHRRLVLAGLTLLLLFGLPAQRRWEHVGAGRWIAALLREPPPGAVVMLSGNDEAFLSIWARRIEGRRPDLLVLPRVLLGHPHEEARTRRPLLERGVPWTPQLRDDPVPLFVAAGEPLWVQRREPEAGHPSSIRPEALLWTTAPGFATEGARARATAEIAGLLAPAPADVEATLVAALQVALDPALEPP